MGRALAVATLSGFAGLGYQIVWTQQGALWLGHEAASALAVIAGFLGGLAVGAIAVGTRIERSARPARWYAACELVIGSWGLALAFAMPHAADAIASAIGEESVALSHWTIAFIGTFALLLPATAAMGATLPALQRMLEGAQRRGGSIAALYAANTIGAVAGVLACAFVMLPAIGLVRTAIVCAACNFACALVAATWRSRALPEPSRAADPQVRTGAGLLAATGFLGIGYEVIALRVLSQVTENTVYTFALLLAVYLAGTSAGAAAYARWGSRNANAATRDRLMLALAAACLTGFAAMAGSTAMKRSILAIAGASYEGALSAEAALAVAAFLLPTIAMGALFSHLATEARNAGLGLARALAINTLGAALAPVAFGVLVIPAFGAKAAVLAVAAGYLVLCSPRAWTAPRQWAAAALVAALAWIGPSLAIVDVPQGGRVVYYREGINAAVSVVEDASGVARLHINNRQQEGSSATVLADSRQALLPILLHREPHRALFLGLGTGVTAYAAAQDDTLVVDAVELLPEVAQASRLFVPTLSGIRIADARRYVRTNAQAYDVIVADNFHPARSGSGSLYTVEHFRAVRARLTRDGVFCQWLPLHQLDVDTLRVIVRAYMEAFPRAYAMLATYSLETPVIGLVARNDGAPFALQDVAARVRTVALPLENFGLDDAQSVLGTFVAGTNALAAFAATAELNTDDRPVVAYRAPRIAYATDSRPRDRLAAVLRDMHVAGDDFAIASAQERTALAAYWRARDRFVEIGRDVAPSTDPRRMLDQVGEPLLAVLRISPQFRPAYDPLMLLAHAIDRSDPQRSHAIIAEVKALRSGP